MTEILDTFKENVNCHFCNRQLSWKCAYIPAKYTNSPLEGRVMTVYYCDDCRSEQDYMIEPTCILCKNKLVGLSQPMYDTKSYKTVSLTNRCPRCQVNQTFTPEGKLISYSFEVLPYLLCFEMEKNQFIVRERSNFQNILLTCNYIPINMTPQNTTAEKVKLLILFS